MDQLSIFELSNDTRVMTTIKELRTLYLNGFEDGAHDITDDDYDDEAATCIKGDIV